MSTILTKPVPLWKIGGLLLAAYLIFGGAKGCDLDIPGVKPKGPFTVMVVRESESLTPAIAAIGVDLQAGPASDALRAAGHTVRVHDPHDKDENDKPLPILEKFKPFVPTGELLLIKPPDSLVDRQPLPPTAAAVVDAVKAKGG